MEQTVTDYDGQADSLTQMLVIIFLIRRYRTGPVQQAALLYIGFILEVHPIETLRHISLEL